MKSAPRPARRRYGVRATAETQLASARLVKELGLYGAAEAMGIGFNSMARVAAGEQVHAATLHLVEKWLAANNAQWRSAAKDLRWLSAATPRQEKTK